MLSQGILVLPQILSTAIAPLPRVNQEYERVHQSEIG